MNFPKFPIAMLAAGIVSLCACGPASATKLPASSANTEDVAPDSPRAQDTATETVVIPGPLNSFLRMAGISQEIAPGEVLPLLARNVFLYGHIGDRKTEYLVLADRYVHQARELQALAGPDGTIHVAGCGDAGALIQVLGYRFENGCSSTDASLVTADAERAFLTVDSGFPLTKLEQALQQGAPFAYAFPATRVPMFFAEKDWTALAPAKRRDGETVLDVLLNDESVDRLYSGLSRLDPQTRLALFKAPGIRRLLVYGPVIDFYGGKLCIRSGAVVVPGGEAAERSWQDLAGASPKSPGEFVTHLFARDQGWLAAYYDALSRVSPEQQARLAQGDRLKRMYAAYRAASPSVAAASSVFPRNSDLLHLLTQLQWDAAGQPEVPGSLDLWREILARDEKSHHLRESAAKFIRASDSPEGLIEALAVYCNAEPDGGPSQIYLTLTAIDGARAPEKRLSNDAARLLADRFSQLNEWYSIFVDFPALDDASISHFVQAVDHVNGIANAGLRSNTLGAFQSELGIWQILARQRQIPQEAVNSSWQSAIKPYEGVSSSIQLFEAARTSLRSILTAAGGSANLTEDQVVDLLAGPAQNSPDGARVHEELARRIHAVLDDQRLVSLDTLFGLYDGLGQMARGAAIGDSLLPLAGALREFELPRPIFTAGERVSWSPMVYVNRHAELQVRTDLTKVIRAGGPPAQLEAARARLAPFLRDTLVGLNYAYYEPPGAQVLHTNPLFVRSHDFSAASVQGVNEVWGAPTLIGIGATAGGGAYLIGSLADLPYVLAQTEEDFISPENIQALIWRETVPELLVNAVLPRWWGVSRDELRAASLYQRSGEELLTASAANSELREKVVGVFSGRMHRERVDDIDQALQTSEGARALAAEMRPEDTLFLSAEFRSKFPGQAPLAGPASRELDELILKDPSDTTAQRISADFGVPHPTLAETNSCGLLTTEPFPISGGEASRLFGESWESSNLYWARLADEKGYSPAALNVLVPELTRQMIANISATSVDDWPALMRAMKHTGAEFLDGRITIHTAGPSAGEKQVAIGGTRRDDDN